MTLPDMLIPTYSHMLRALSAWLAKAEMQLPGGPSEALLSARLAPDMFPLSTQIRFACVQAQEGVLRLHRRDFPPAIDTLLNEDAMPPRIPARSPMRRRGSARLWRPSRPSIRRRRTSRPKRRSPMRCRRV